MSITINKLLLIDETAKFRLNIVREANFIASPAVYPFMLESVAEWQCDMTLLEEFYQNDYAYQIGNNQNSDDDEKFDYPLWHCGESWHKSKNIEEWIENGDSKEFLNQFIEKNESIILLETQFCFKSEMKIVLNDK